MTLTRSQFVRTVPSKEPKVRVRKCAVKSCRQPFEPRSMTHKCCGPICAALFAVAERVRKDRKERQEGLAKLKRRADYLKEAQTALNAWIRARDAELPCVSCDRPATWDGQWHASHYRSVGSSPGTRFCEANIHKACSICNNHLSGNIREYRPRLIARIGLAAVEALEGDTTQQKWTIPELQAMKDEYRARLRALTNSRT
jgi:hypothetical protein